MASLLQFLGILIFLPVVFNNSTASLRAMDTGGKGIHFPSQSQQPQFTCFQLYALPMTILLYALRDYYNYMCNPSDYFKGCREQFLQECMMRACDTSTLPFWIDTFPNTAKDVICRHPFSGIDDVNKNGGSDCLKNINIDPQVMNLFLSVYFGQTVSCSDMDKYMHNVLNELDKCSNKGIRTLIARYFYSSVDNSICRGKIIIEGGSDSGSNIISSLLFSVFATTISLFIGSFHW